MRLKDDAIFIIKKYEQQKAYRSSERYREKHRAYMMEWRKRKPRNDRNRAERDRRYKLRSKPGKLRQVDYTLTLHGETIVAHVLTTRRDAA
jgi:hypothetical protein